MGVCKCGCNRLFRAGWVFWIRTLLFSVSIIWAFFVDAIPSAGSQTAPISLVIKRLTHMLRLLFLLCVVGCIVYGAQTVLPETLYLLGLETILRPMMLSEHIVIPNCSKNEDASSLRIDGGGGLVIKPILASISHCTGGDHHIWAFSFLGPLIGGSDLGNVGCLELPRRSIDGWRSTCVAEKNSYRNLLRDSWRNFLCGGLHIKWSNPRSLFQMEIFNSGSKRFLCLSAVGFRRISRHLLGPIRRTGHPIDVSNSLPNLVCGVLGSPSRCVGADFSVPRLIGADPGSSNAKQNQNTLRNENANLNRRMSLFIFALLYLLCAFGCLISLWLPWKDGNPPNHFRWGIFTVFMIIGQWGVFRFLKESFGK